MGSQINGFTPPESVEFFFTDTKKIEEIETLVELSRLCTGYPLLYEGRWFWLDSYQMTIEVHGGLSASLRLIRADEDSTRVASYVANWNTIIPSMIAKMKRNLDLFGKIRTYIG